MKLLEGNLFELSMSEGVKGIGQIVAMPNKETIGVVIYEIRYSTVTYTDYDKLTESNILLFANTYDAKLHHGDWKIIDTYTSNLPLLRLPVYKIGLASSLRYEKYDETPIRIEEIEMSGLTAIPNRSFVAPIRVENAAKAHFGYLDWVPEYDKLLYKNMPKLKRNNVL